MINSGQGLELQCCVGPPQKDFESWYVSFNCLCSALMTLGTTRSTGCTYRMEDSYPPHTEFPVKGKQPLLCLLTETSDLTESLMVISLTNIESHVPMRETRERTDQAKGQESILREVIFKPGSKERVGVNSKNSVGRSLPGRLTACAKVLWLEDVGHIW